jgi:hypothetical protein
MEKILLAQFIAHIMADFFGQPECVCEGKQRHIFTSWHIYVHALIVFAVSFALTFTCGFVFWACWIAVAHFAVDAVKCAVGRLNKNNRALFLADQILHFTVIWVAVALYVKTGGTVPRYLDGFTVRQLTMVLGLLLCLKPANVLIRVCLSSLKTNGAIADILKDESLQRAGRWIGALERAMAFVLILLGQFTAIGFIIAAKSVLRYGEAQTGKTEYVLLGTLMSFAVAFALGVGITSGVFENVINIISCNI